MSIYRSTTIRPGNRPDSGSIPEKYTVSASTHEGMARPVNEDNLTVNGIVGLTEGARRSLRGSSMDEPLVCAVFDGTGGETAGVASSKLAAEYAVWLYKNLLKNPFERERLVNHFVSEANDCIVEKYYSVNGRRGATTFVMAIISSGRLYSYSLGDSRLYLYSGGRLYLLTHDHTVAMERYREGVYTLKEAERSPDRYKLTGFLGIAPSSAAKPERYDVVHLRRGDRLMLCSDGLYSILSDDDISGILSSGKTDKACDLINCAVARGAGDNLTCTVIECN